MARVPVSGHNTTVLTTPGSNMLELIAGLNPDADGKIFYLTTLQVANEHASQVAVVELADQNEAAITAANQRGAPIHVPAVDTVLVEYKDDAMPFVTNLVGAVTNGTVATLSVLAAGYLS